MEIVLFENEPISSVMEAKTVNDIPDLIYRREKITLPYDKKDRLKGYMTFALNVSLDSIAKIMDNQHPFISNPGNMYKTYYYDYTSLRGSLKCERFNVPGITVKEAKQQRLVNYGLIKNSLDGVLTPMKLELAREKNMIYDLQPVVDYMRGIAKLSRLPIIVRLKTYFDTLYGFYSKTYEGYVRGPILVDMDSFPNDATLNNYHALLYILTLFTRSETSLVDFRIPMEFLFYSKKGYVKFNLSTDLYKANFAKFRNAIKRMQPKSVEDVVDKIIKAEVVNSFNVKMGFTGDMALNPDDEVVDTLKSTIRKDLDEEGETDTPDDEVEIIDEIDEEIEENLELKKEIFSAMTKKKAGTASEASLKRDALLREKQKDIIVKTKTIGELKKTLDTKPISVKEIKLPEVVNTEISSVKFDNFEKDYNTTTLEKDIANAITLFNDKTINVNVIDVKVEDTSDVMSAKETYTISLEDENRKRHTVTVNLPKFIDDKFMYLNGNKRIIKKQFVGLPVIKTKQDEVQICSAAYNKIFITRVGSRFNPNMEKFKKLLMDDTYGIRYRKGNNTVPNSGKLTCLEYDEFASKYTEIVIGDYHFVFNINLLEQELGREIDSTLDKYLIGYKVEKNLKKIPIYYDHKNEDHVDLVSTMILTARPEIYDDFKSKGFGKKYIYTSATIMAKKIPVIVLLCFFEGLSTVIRKFNDESVKIVDKKSNKDNYMYIPFANGYLQYPMSNIEACILFNGLTEIPTQQYNLSDMDERESYIDIFEYLYGSAYIMGGLLNFYDFMIDPITLEIIQMLGYPEDLVSLIIYANNLLADNQYDSDMSLGMYRLRDNEIVPAILYKELTRAYSRYRKTQNSKTQTKLSVDPDCVIKALNNIPTVSDYSRLSPILEYRELHTASMKGYIGMNLDDAYSEQKRIYHDSMRGIVGMSTDIAGNTGKERHLVVEPKVKNVRGMMDLTPKGKQDDLDFTQLETGIELFVPGGLRHDDERRTAMSVKQKGHLIPVKNQSPLLVTNGMDSMIHYRTCDDFSVVAEEDGKVIDFDNASKVMIIEYKSGKRKAIELSQKQVKNGGGGIYLRNELVSSFVPGDTFKKDAIIAYDKYFYRDTGPFGNRLMMGTLVKSACISHSSTYEDSTWFTSKLARDMSVDISMPVETVVGKNATVDFIVKPGDKIKIGDPLIKFETSYDHDELNELLGAIRSDLHEEIINFGKTSVTSHYAGVVDDVIVYSSVEPEELSPTLRKIVNDCLKSAKSKRKILNKYDNENGNNYYKLGLLLDKPEGKVEPDRYGKIGGKDVADGVLIKFFVTYHDELSDGDKLIHMTANKATCGFKIPDTYEPRTAFRPYEEVSIPVAPSAVLQRGTPTIITDMCSYKILIETKRKMYEILTGESWNEKMKRENPYMILDQDVMESNSQILDICNIVGGKVLSEGIYMPGDILFTGDVATEVYKYISENDALVSYREPNVRYDSVEEAIIATDTIYTTEVLRVDF